MQVYENPQTIFVAGFIGSPSMNFVPGKGSGNNAITLDSGGQVTASVHVASGRAVTVGIRPEHAQPMPADDAAVSGTVEMVEQLGADALVHIAYGGSPLVVRVPHGQQPQVGERFGVRIDPARVFIFDSASGSRVRN